MSPADRHNVGTVIGLDDTAGQVTVRFVSTDGRDATHTFGWADLRLLGPAAEPRTLTSAAQQTLAVIDQQATDRIASWQQTVRVLGIEPGDADRYAHAMARHLERHAYALAATRPGWLTHVLGDRPADVAGATAWDDTVRDIAAWRAHQNVPDHVGGLGTRPDDPGRAAEWDKLQTRLGLTRTWLATSDRIQPADTVTPSFNELLDRRDELDSFFSEAPPDWRTTIARLEAGQLTLEDTADLLRAALDGRQARQHWILRNWPHVVEYQEINRTLTTGTWGPDPQLLTDLLTQPLTDSLAAAIQRGDPWLRVALGVVAGADTTVLDADAIDWLEGLAVAREEEGIAPAAPLDPSWSSPSCGPGGCTAHRRARRFGVRRLRPLGDRPPVSSRPWGSATEKSSPSRPSTRPLVSEAPRSGPWRGGFRWTVAHATWSWALRSPAHP